MIACMIAYMIACMIAMISIARIGVAMIFIIKPSRVSAVSLKGRHPLQLIFPCQLSAAWPLKRQRRRVCSGQ